MEIDKFKQLGKALVEFFYPLVEVTLFDAKGASIEVLNPFSSLAEDQGSEMEDLQKEGAFHEVLATGGHSKRMVYPIRSTGDKICGFLRIRYDTTKFHHLKEQLDFLLQPQFGEESDQRIGQWQTGVDQVIAQYLKEHQITMQAATGKQKRELIGLLDSKKLFEFKEASAYIASKMHTSRATVYNYLKTISTLQQVEIHQVDAFTDKKFGGNPAGVVLDAKDLDEAAMRKIARELNLSETAFVLPSKKGDFRFRYFTPTGHEISFCGHSTVGALFVIAHKKQYQIKKPGTYTFNIETLSGVLKMQALIDQNEKIRVTYEPPEVKLEQPKISHKMLAKAASIDLEWIDVTRPILYDSVSKNLFISMRSLENLKQMECDFKSLASFSKEHEIVALCFLTNETFDSKNQIHMRCFSPLVGVNEDPFTGSVLGGLTIYADRFDLLPKKTTVFRVEQGHFLNRPGFVEVEFAHRGDVYHIKVIAQAVHCFSTEINLA